MTRILIALMALCGSLNAATYYVAKNGSDSNTKAQAQSQSTPWLTIQKAATEMIAGDRVYVKAGTYNETVTPGASGTANSLIQYLVWPGDTVIIDAQNSRNYCIIMSSGGRSYLHFEGFQLRNAVLYNVQISSGNQYVTFKNVSATGAARSAFYGGSSSYITIDGGSFTGNGFGTATSFGGFYIDGGAHYWTIKNATVADNYMDGITMNSSSVSNPVRNAHIQNNQIYGNRRQGVLTIRVSGALIENNNIYNNGATGIQIEIRCYDIRVRNNVSRDNNWLYGSETGIWIDETDGYVVEGNTLSGNTRGLYISQSYHGISRNNLVYNNKSQNTPVGNFKNWSTGLGFSWGNQAGIDNGTPGGAAFNRIVHNTFYDNGHPDSTYGGHHVALHHVNIVSNKFVNNILSNVTGQRETDLRQGYNYELIDWNLYYNPARALKFMQVSTDYTWTTWRGLGRDPNSLQSNPLFVNPPVSFELQASSPAINAGGWLATTTGAGSGTVIPVSDPYMFSAGYTPLGVLGDEIQLQGQTTRRRVTAVDLAAKTITVNGTLTWTSGLGVAYSYLGSKPTMGAVLETVTPPTPPPPTAFYVSPDGNDNNPGTQAQPFRTFFQANRVATNGTTIFVMDGTYTSTEWPDDRVMNITKSGTTWRSLNHRKAIIQGNGRNGTIAMGIVIGSNVQNVTVEGFTIRSVHAAGIRLPSRNFNTVIRSNYIHDVGSKSRITELQGGYDGRTGISIGLVNSTLGNAQGDIIISHNEIGDTYRPPWDYNEWLAVPNKTKIYEHEFLHDHPIYINGNEPTTYNKNYLIFANTFYEAFGGYAPKITSPGVTNAWLVNNTIIGGAPGYYQYVTKEKGHPWQQWFSGTYNVADVYYVNNLITQSRGNDGGVFFVYDAHGGGLHNINLWNNVVVGTIWESTVTAANKSRWTIQNNLIGPSVVHGVVNTNAGAYNYRLTSSSDAIGKGMNMTARLAQDWNITSPRDFYGNPFPSSGPWDAGAVHGSATPHPSSVAYVSPAGSDTFGTGSFTNPWKTIWHAADNMVPGGTLYLRGGVYTDGGSSGSPEGATFNRFKSGTAVGQFTRILGYPGETAIWRPVNTGTTWLTTIGTHGSTTVAPKAASNIWFGDFTIDMANTTTSYGALFLTAWRDVVITNMTFLNSPQAYGWIVAGGNPYHPGGTNLTIVSNRFDRWAYTATSSMDGKHAMYISKAQGLKIIGNTFTDEGPPSSNNSFGIHLYNSTNPSFCTNAIIEGNFADAWQTSMAAGNLSGGNVRNNVFRPGAGRNGISFGYGSRQVQVDNNTIFGGIYGISLRYGTQPGNIFRNNVAWGQTGHAFYIQASGDGAYTQPSYWTNNLGRTFSDTGNFGVKGQNWIGDQFDPRFLNPPSNLRFTAPDSPLWNRGSSLPGIVDWDFDVQPRDDGAWDIGAFEFKVTDPNEPEPETPPVSIVANGEFAFAASETPQTFTVTRSGTYSGLLDVYFAASGTAVAGQDYIALSSPVTMASGSATATITVTPKKSTAQDLKTVTITLLPSGGYSVGAPEVATISIVPSESTTSISTPLPGQRVRRKDIR
jgi:parallel beta-helix repeat protein